MRTLWIMMAMMVACVVGCPAPSPTPSPGPVDPNASTLIIEQTNAARQQAGLPPLTANSKLMKAAQDYAALMNQTQTLSHSVNGETVQIRLANVGYQWQSAGENIASGYAPNNVVDAWMSSPGHRANILDSRYKEIGVGVSGKYYSQMFGQPEQP